MPSPVRGIVTGHDSNGTAVTASDTLAQPSPRGWGRTLHPAMEHDRGHAWRHRVVPNGDCRCKLS
jgi:hypothetical protein